MVNGAYTVYSVLYFELIRLMKRKRKNRYRNFITCRLFTIYLFTFFFSNFLCRYLSTQNEWIWIWFVVCVCVFVGLCTTTIWMGNKPQRIQFIGMKNARSIRPTVTNWSFRSNGWKKWHSNWVIYAILSIFIALFPYHPHIFWWKSIMYGIISMCSVYKYIRWMKVKLVRITHRNDGEWFQLLGNAI